MCASYPFKTVRVEQVPARRQHVVQSAQATNNTREPGRAGRGRRVDRQHADGAILLVSVGVARGALTRLFVARWDNWVIIIDRWQVLFFL